MLSFKPGTLRTALETSIAEWQVRKPELTKLKPGMDRPCSRPEPLRE